MKYLLVFYGGGMPDTPAAQARVLKQWRPWFKKLGPGWSTPACPSPAG